MNDADKRYYGKYRGIVTQNIDDENRGRIKVRVADVTNMNPSTWAEACVPFAGGPDAAGVYVVPPVGASVWIEFEKGDIRNPIWTGCFWKTKKQVPPQALKEGSDRQLRPSIVLQTPGKNSIVLSDLSGSDGGIRLTCSSGAHILINNDGITISNGKKATIKLVGEKSILMNEDGLKIT
jgi:uncharacterized protein involved in type VI secretion and phage assembly